MATKKELTLLHLQRRHKDLTETVPDHVKMAAASVDYKARQRAVEAHEAEKEKHRPEIDALQNAIEFITDFSNADMTQPA